MIILQIRKRSKSKKFHRDGTIDFGETGETKINSTKFHNDVILYLIPLKFHSFSKTKLTLNIVFNFQFQTDVITTTTKRRPYLFTYLSYHCIWGIISEPVQYISQMYCSNTSKFTYGLLCHVKVGHSQLLSCVKELIYI